MSESGIDFPTDLLQAARRFHQANAELEALDRPRFVEDYPEGVAETEARLRAQMRDLAAALATHPFWDSFSGPARVAARTELKQQAKKALGQPTG
ncbi:hypothetical protein ACGRHY_30130 [Streptomyces sp. HK10]|uniref:hypothetical protein n=1 Tax=Streptomyces sp. HK10 TaxID=3373255 RepID=UPI00374811D9